MDHTLLTAVHLRKFAPVKMDTRQEQEYYDRAVESLALLEKVPALLNRTRSLCSACLALFQTMGVNLGHSLTARKALH